MSREFTYIIEEPDDNTIIYHYLKFLTQYTNSPVICTQLPNINEQTLHSNFFHCNLL